MWLYRYFRGVVVFIHVNTCDDAIPFCLYLKQEKKSTVIHNPRRKVELILGRIKRKQSTSFYAL